MSQITDMLKFGLKLKMDKCFRLAQSTGMSGQETSLTSSTPKWVQCTSNVVRVSFFSNRRDNLPRQIAVRNFLRFGSDKSVCSFGIRLQLWQIVKSSNRAQGNNKRTRSMSLQERKNTIFNWSPSAAINSLK